MKIDTQEINNLIFVVVYNHHSFISPNGSSWGKGIRANGYMSRLIYENPRQAIGSRITLLDSTGNSVVWSSIIKDIILVRKEFIQFKSRKGNKFSIIKKYVK